VKKNKLKVASLAVISLFLLTACDPPMPPEALLAQTESTYVCLPGNANVYLDGSVSEILASVVPSLEMNCPEMTISSSEFSEAQVSIGSLSETGGQKWDVTVPYAVEAGVFAIISSSGAGALLSPSSVQGIVDGTIKTWDNPTIVRDNDGVAPIEGPLTFIPVVQAEAKKALEVWYEHFTGKALNVSSLQEQASVTSADYADLPEGSVAFMPISIFNELSISSMITPMPATLLVDKAKDPGGAVLDFNSVYAGSSQWKKVDSGSGVLGVNLDFTSAPVPPAGFDVAPTPYQIIYPVYLRVASGDDLLARAVARYLLRQDSQAVLTLVYGLPTDIRAAAIQSVSEGLPLPKP
jgi:hypothetical protein